MTTNSPSTRPRALSSLSITVPKPTFTKMDPSVLSAMLSQEDVVVVDVRDDDYLGGAIKGSIRLPFSEFEGKVDDLVKQLIKDKKETVVFYCMFSQQRAPTCASTFVDAATQLESNNIKVYVLSGGFHLWLKTFSDSEQGSADATYVQDFDRNYWKFDPVSSTLFHKEDVHFLPE
ncbi:YCH1, partial [Acrasis kona]